MNCEKLMRMICSWKYFELIIIGVLGLTTINANVITSKAVDCECFNNTAHTNSQDDCKDGIVKCVNTDSDRPGACFVLWATDNVTGMYFKLKITWIKAI